MTVRLRRGVKRRRKRKWFGKRRKREGEGGGASFGDLRGNHYFTHKYLRVKLVLLFVV